MFFARTASELAGIYGQISDELSSQYMIGYTSQNPKRDGAWRRIVVRMNRAEHHRAHQTGLLRANLVGVEVHMRMQSAECDYGLVNERLRHQQPALPSSLRHSASPLT